MKELHSPVNRKTYYISMFMMITLMVAGLVLSTTELETVTTSYVIHLLCVVIIPVCLIIYPRYETFAFRLSIILLGFVYFYTLALAYPQTWSTYIMICLLPALAILFYDFKLFYISLSLNVVLLLIVTFYIHQQEATYAYIHTDLIGNLINIMASQLLLFLIFYLTFDRIRKQELYLEQVQQSERLKMVAHLTAAVAHEIRNPVTVVRGFLQLYRENPAFDTSDRSKFALMIDELNTVEQVTSQFLSIAKPNRELLQVERVDVREVLEGVASLLGSYATLSNKHIDIQAGEDCAILMNSIEFKQVIINLIKNALEASDTGTMVHVTARRVKKTVEIRIIDQGCGMTEEEVKALGTPFYSLKTNGTGLGLMICFNIVQKVGGSIKYQSEKGKGTTVILTFPAADPS
ncbi:sensor histidine kinase [Paenibacillus silvae]|uniref:sensor histidine kinase n=1 Tax=Paenibacillus silvae TaxID=1325358 RepID=UPI0011AA9B58|nr:MULTISPECIES: HAMP domain-containing sensor histidine kinase [Paenibacillus]MCK6076707.1 HAMP domain-containing histidine kinase [Paenibacillus silvae]MCK6151134.1 HAMP domain-containing histidine kinase [Paenibacillus silvae]MCK6269393.1 HAMP domain-containing histidine kinase [Paenibacillus silvae]